MTSPPQLTIWDWTRHHLAKKKLHFEHPSRWNYHHSLLYEVELDIILRKKTYHFEHTSRLHHHHNLPYEIELDIILRKKLSILNIRPDDITTTAYFIRLNSTSSWEKKPHYFEHTSRWHHHHSLPYEVELYMILRIKLSILNICPDDITMHHHNLPYEVELYMILQKKLFILNIRPDDITTTAYFMRLNLTSSWEKKFKSLGPRRNTLFLH